jgi:hypothetical protein
MRKLKILRLEKEFNDESKMKKLFIFDSLVEWVFN